MTKFELDIRNFERKPQRHEISTKFHYKIEEFFDILETEDVDTSTTHYIIYLIVKRDFGNNFHHQNGPNQCQHTQKTTRQQYKSKYFQRSRN